MVKRPLRLLVNRLQSTRLRPLVTAAASVYASARDRRPHIFSVDADGDWVNWMRGTTFVSPIRHIQTIEEIEKSVHDHWSYKYFPRSGDVVVDVGAGIGEETVVYSRVVGEAGRIIAIEAHPHTFACLEKTVRSNRLTNVTTINCAITGRAEQLFISDDTTHHLANTVLSGINTIIDGRARIPIEGRTLDAVFSDLKLTRVDLLKMNIEGAEKPALLGMNESVKITRAVAISCHDFCVALGAPESMRTRVAVEAFLQEHGFGIERRPDDPRTWVPDFLYGTNRAGRAS